MTFYDSYWEAAANAALRALREAEYVLVPAEFLPLDPRFAPLEFSWGLKGVDRLAWCCPKDDLGKIAPWLLERAGDDTPCYPWANEVFVLGGNFRWAWKANEETEHHLVAWFQRVERYRSGVSARASREGKASFPSDQATGLADWGTSKAAPRVLIVGASGMGNVGDDLIADVLADLCAQAGADAHTSGPDIDPLHAAKYDAIIVGGGGLIYADRDGEDETQNLANYLRFSAIGHHFGVPVGLIGVGDQETRDGKHEPVRLGRNRLTERFVGQTLPLFKVFTTRDADSTHLLSRLGAEAVQTGADLLFCRAQCARKAVRPTIVTPKRVALIGEFYKHASLANALNGDKAPLASLVREGDFDILVMSNDDVPHAERMRTELQKLGASASILDLRPLDFASLVYLFATYQSVVTTRFHGLVLALLTDVPVLAFDIETGKCARLLRDLDAEQSLVTKPAESVEIKLEQALTGRLRKISRDRVAVQIEKADAHKAAVSQLLSSHSPTAPSGDPKPFRLTGPALGRPRDLGRISLLPSEPIPLCWAASTPETAGCANLGDSLSAVIVTALAAQQVQHTHFDAECQKLVAVGSIGHAIRGGDAVLWGTGVSIRGALLARNVPYTRYDIRAVRGPISAQHLRDFGLDVPEIYGDPVWLMPFIVDESVQPRYELGIIPHIRDVAHPHPDAPPKANSLRWTVSDADTDSVVVINTWHRPTWEGFLEKVRMILSCKRIVSQSFHGLVLAEAYGIPALNIRWVPDLKQGPARIDLTQDCKTDPRVWEFYKGGRREYFHMYNQRRDARSDWDAVIRAIDALWEPFDYDPIPLIEAFPLTIACAPWGTEPLPEHKLKSLKF